MPSLLTRLLPRKDKNPYTNPQHPTHGPPPTKHKPHPPQPQPQPADYNHQYERQQQQATHQHRAQQRYQPPRDLLAEARLVAGRDPVTGRALSPSPSPSPLPVARAAPAVSKIAAKVGSVSVSPSSPAALQTEPQATRARYEGVVGEARRAQEACDEAERVGFYAPRRQVVEFYARGDEGR